MSRKTMTYSLRGILWCLLLCLTAAGCSHDDGYPGGNADSPATPKAYVRLSFGIHRAADTRAIPTGGEEGDGTEAGQPNENAITTAVAFFYDGTVNGEGAANTPVIPVRFDNVRCFDSETYTTPAQEVQGLQAGSYHVLVVANPGTDDWWSASTTLGAVRDHIQKTAWEGDDEKGYSNFLMTSAKEAILTVDNDNSEEYPATTEISVERMAARVDYQAENSYDCTNEEKTGATVEITGATLINSLNAGSYLLKRVAATVNGTPTYLGDETAKNGVATNYVLDPWTAQKNADFNDATGLYVTETYLPNGSTNPEDWADYCRAGTSLTDPDTRETWQRVGYTLENTTDGGLTTEVLQNYATGLVFKAEYHPKDLAGYEEGHTFFSYNGTLYASLTALMENLNPQVNFSDIINNVTDWAGLEAVIAPITKDPVGYKAYLTAWMNEHENEDYSSNRPDDWATYLKNELGVVEDGTNGPLINQGKENTRALLYEKSGERLRTYYQSQCYYLWWLRHSNDDKDETNGIMEYAIVRNNIYKVSVTGVYGLGGDIPEIADNGLRITIRVKNWTMLDEETLPM